MIPPPSPGQETHATGSWPVDPDLDPPSGQVRAGRLFARPQQASRRLRRHADVLATIALGGGLGSVARYLLIQTWPARAGAFPWATFTVNVTGCFLLGAVMVLMLQVWPPSRYLRPFLGVGVCGGFTTFSTYALEVRDLAAAGRWTLANAYTVDTLFAALAAVWLGVVAARLLMGLPVRRRHRASTTISAGGE